jgi:hypothetical protein
MLLDAPCVTAQQTMVAQEPEVARHCDRILGRLGNSSSTSSDPASPSASASDRSSSVASKPIRSRSKLSSHSQVNSS